MKTILINFITYLILITPNFAQLADHIVIAEVYGGGGNAGSYWQNDYIILYNPTPSAVDVSTWSVQYAASLGTSWHVTPLTGSIPPLSYYSIQEAQGSGGIEPLPFTPNVTGTIAMSATSGKVALVNNQTPLSGADPFPNVSIIDFIGYGSSASAFEGTGPTTNLSNTSSARRKDNNGNDTYGTNGSGWDTNDNSGDFYEEMDLVNNAPLPVELSSFTASQYENGVLLKWRTETEVDNYGFEVERNNPPHSPLPGGEEKGWVKIGFVEGHGNSNSSKNYSFTDENISAGTYSYRLKQIDNDGIFEYSDIVEITIGSPEEFQLEQNYPNPFNPTTTIKYSIPGVISTEERNLNVLLKVYDVLGNEITTLVNEEKPSGNYSVEFNAANLPSGIYFYTLESGTFVQTKKMLFLK